MSGTKTKGNFLYGTSCVSVNKKKYQSRTSYVLSNSEIKRMGLNERNIFSEKCSFSQVSGSKYSQKYKTPYLDSRR